MTCGCQNIQPHYSARYDFSCLGCAARWILDCYVGPSARLAAIESNKVHDIDALKGEVKRQFELRKKL